MDFSYILEYEGISIYEASKRSGIPYSTLSDIVRGRTPIERVSSGNLHALAKVLDMSMDDLYYQMFVPERTSFENFKSQTRHELKRVGETQFINELVNTNIINKYWNLEWFYEAFYLLAMLDYLYRVNKIVKDDQYEHLRTYKLPEIVYPMDILMAARIGKKYDIRRQAECESIPEFMKYNIVEKEVNDVY